MRLLLSIDVTDIHVATGIPIGDDVIVESPEQSASPLVSSARSTAATTTVFSGALETQSLTLLLDPYSIALVCFPGQVEEAPGMSCCKGPGYATPLVRLCQHHALCQFCSHLCCPNGHAQDVPSEQLLHVLARSA